MKTLTVARRFCGPPQSANGGYFAGLVAGLASHTLSVRLRMPPPLDTELAVIELPGGGLEVRHGEQLVGEASPAQLAVQPPPPPAYLEAIEASRNYIGFTFHRFPTCFVCGVQRPRGDGMRIFAGAVAGRDLVAAPWVPDTSLDRGDGKVRPEFMSAALDCPGYYAVTPDHRSMLLAQFTTHLDRLVHVGESCTVIGWRIGSSGRKHEAGTALFDEDGELCGRAQALWIEPRSG
ncbi:MAG TPA: hypothetical protein VLX90_11940 [Steroidobacteraceae bacterium]|nr:hypothetical protein [Steroidobacteraceae bacterium]